MRFLLIKAIVATGVLAGCASTKPAEVLDERTGTTVGALQDPIEFVETARNAASVGGKRTSFAYLGPLEWDRAGEISYGLWLHVAPGNDKPVGDIRSEGSVRLNLDDGSVVLSPLDASIAGVGTATAAPSALIGINPTGTSSTMYLCVQEDGVPVAW